jgi:hypothetical protein
MPTEAPPIGTGVLPPRAVIAQLTLQLRTALEEADTAEAEDADMDDDTKLAQRRAELEEEVLARRVELDAALELARAEAVEAIAEAHRQSTATVVVAPECIEPSVSALPPINIVIDAEAFARVLATVLSERLPAWGTGAIDSGPLPVGAPRPSMKHARHLDVFLIGVATLIVLVILAAWIG